METKEQLVQSIREWVKMDNEMRTLKKELNDRKKAKEAISVNLLSVMKQNAIDGFDINDGRIEYTTRNVKRPITKKMLLNILSQYYEGDEVKASNVNEYILSNRGETTKEVIVRKMDKK
jgi:hypothetical protein